MIAVKQAQRQSKKAETVAEQCCVGPGKQWHVMQDALHGRWQCVEQGDATGGGAQGRVAPCGQTSSTEGDVVNREVRVHRADGSAQGSAA